MLGGEAHVLIISGRFRTGLAYALNLWHLVVISLVCVKRSMARCNPSIPLAGFLQPPFDGSFVIGDFLHVVHSGIPYSCSRFVSLGFGLKKDFKRNTTPDLLHPNLMSEICAQ